MPQSLSFPDQSHINRVRDALWERPNGRASIMVGAGFSRNAISIESDDLGIPLWRDITKELFNRLYPQYAGDVSQNVGKDAVAANDALRLAQEYETGFGRSDLNKFLQELVRNNEFSPGDMHVRLLRLPWRDVFTTNWDTLLERTTPHITERAYSVIQNMDEIPLKSQPRIVKLNGSLPSQFPLISTEEDYRTYPTKYAPFVNTVQQAMMETVFCLIGFSGDDPNFLQWSGWVRDNLGEAAPKIYLADWLDLSNHRRRMLEDRGIVPIDLARHPKAQRWPEHLRHEYAARWVLHTLENGKPYERTTWPSLPVDNKSNVPESLQPVEDLVSKIPQIQPERKRNSEKPFDKKEELERVRKALEVWKHNRELYPGWLVFPLSEEQERLSWNTNEWESPILNALPELAPVEQLHAIRELMWRREILLEPLKPNLEEKAEEVLNSIDCEKHTVKGVVEARTDWTDIREAWRSVGLVLITVARTDCNKALFEQRLDALEPSANDHIDVAHQLQHERCLWNILSLDFDVLNQRLDNWNVANCDPIWMLRKAALLTEAGRTDESEPLVQNALDLIRENYARNGIIENASRESWALASALTLETRQEFGRRWERLASLKCDALQEIDILTRRIRGKEERDEAPAFDLGTKRSVGMRISNEEYDRAVSSFRGLRLLEVTGLPPTNIPSGKYRMPLSLGQKEVLTSAAEKLATIAPDLSIRLVLRVCSDDGDKTLDRVLARNRVATLSEDSAKTLAEICKGVIVYAFPRLNAADIPPQLNAWVRRMRVALEVLSRLVLRLSDDFAAAALELGIDCLRNPTIRGNILFGRPISNLLERSWYALPDERRAQYALRLLTMPLEGLDGLAAEPGYLDPGSLVIHSNAAPVRSRDNEDDYGNVVKFLISGLKSEDNEAREQAAHRLAFLMKSECLTDDEKTEAANVLWSTSGTINPDIFTHRSRGWLYLALPELKRGQADHLFRDNFLSTLNGVSDDLSLSESSLYQVGSALDYAERYGYSLSLSSAEQRHLLDCMQVVAANLLGERKTITIGLSSRRRAAYGIRSILAKIEIPEDVAKDLYVKVNSMRDINVKRFSARISDPIYAERVAFVYAVLLGLVRAMPDRVDDLSGWIRMGLTSDDGLQVMQSISTLQSWMSVATSGSDVITPPPNDLVREIGVAVGTRRKVALPNALEAATWIFEGGNTEQQEAISQLALPGLLYLAEELRYDREHEDGNSVPTLRFLCAQLAKSMAQKGYADSPAISGWLEIAKDDPLPEVRHLITPDE